MHSQRRQHIRILQSTETVMVDVVYRKQAIRIHDALFPKQSNRRAANTIRSIRDIVERRSRLVQTRNRSHSSACRTIPDHWQPYAVWQHYRIEGFYEIKVKIRTICDDWWYTTCCFCKEIVIVYIYTAPCMFCTSISFC